MHAVLRHLRRAALFSCGDNLSDAQLLESFLSGHDDAAFELIMRRHGPMVLAVCRRILGNPQDIEDVFQATFMVLIRKAGSLRSQALLGNWLYGVAYRTAKKARTMNAKRRAREQAAGTKAQANGVDDELLEHLDAALQSLPDKFRAALVLCELEGKTRKEAARVLGLTEGSVAWRLSQGKKMLAKKLTRYVGAVSEAALATALAEGASSVPRLLLTTTLATARQFALGGTLKAGVASAQVVLLTEGVIKAMLLSKLKLVGVAILVLSLGAGATGIGLRAGAAENPTKMALNEVEALRAEVEALRKLVLVTRDRVQTLEKEVETLKTPPPRPTTIGQPNAPLYETPAPAHRPAPANTAPKRPGKPTPPAAPQGLFDPAAPAPMPNGPDAAPLTRDPGKVNPPAAPQGLFEPAVPSPMPNGSDAAPQSPTGAAARPMEKIYLQRQPGASTLQMPQQPNNVPEYKRDDATRPSPEPRTEALRQIDEYVSKQLTKQVDPFAEAEEALKQLRAHPDSKEAADKLENALKRLKVQTQTRTQPTAESR
jgi:RNA polymerase sigma factor (sigma-70 family)